MIVSVPLLPAALPMNKTPAGPIVQVEPAPLTVAWPTPPSRWPTYPAVLETVPPPVIASVPVPCNPTSRAAVQVQVEPGPSTVAFPVLPASSPREERLLETVPPLVIVNSPSPPLPTYIFQPLLSQVEPAPSTVTAPRESTAVPM